MVDGAEAGGTSNDYWIAFAHELLGERDLALAGYERELARQLRVNGENPDDPFIVANLSAVYVGLRRRKEAMREAERAVALLPVSRDAMYGPVLIRNLAWTYARVGEPEKAVEQLEQLLIVGGGIFWQFHL